MQASTNFGEKRIIRSLSNKSCCIAASAQHVMMNQNLTYVREMTTLIHSNAVDVIDQDLHLILQGWETSTPPKWQQQQQKQGWANARGKKIRMDGEMVDQWRDEETDGCRQYGCEE